MILQVLTDEYAEFSRLESENILPKSKVAYASRIRALSDTVNGFAFANNLQGFLLQYDSLGTRTGLLLGTRSYCRNMSNMDGTVSLVRLRLILFLSSYRIKRLLSTWQVYCS